MSQGNDEIFLVTDMEAAYAGLPKSRWPRPPTNPVVASTIGQIQRLDFPELMIEIRRVAKM